MKIQEKNAKKLGLRNLMQILDCFYADTEKPFKTLSKGYIQKKKSNGSF